LWQATELDPKFAAAYNFLAWLLATCPESKVRAPRRGVDLAKKAVDLAPTEATYWNTLGTAYYYASECKPAIEALKKSMDLSKGGSSFDSFFLAMAHWQLGEKDQARHWYEQAVQWMDKNQKQLEQNKQWDEELRRFRSEAAELLGIKDEKTHHKDTKDTEKNN